MTKLRLGVIGAGSWAVASHLPNFAARKDEVEFVGVCRKGPAMLEKIKNDWGFQVASEDYQDVIDAGHRHLPRREPARHALRAREGGARGRRARALREAVHRRSRGMPGSSSRSPTRKELHLLLSYGWNYRPWMREAKRLMDEYGIGEIEQSAIQMASSCPRAAREPRRLPAGRARHDSGAATWTDPANGGGYGQAQLSHALGVALWLTGLRGDSAFALMKAVLDAPVEHHDAVVIRYDNGSIGTMAGGSATSARATTATSSRCARSAPRASS